MIKLKVKVTREILLKAMWCTPEINASDCAITEAVRGVFPEDHTGYQSISPFGWENDARISLPIEARVFVHNFDKSTPTERSLMPEMEFEINVSDEIIEHVDISDVIEILKNSETLELV